VDARDGGTVRVGDDEVPRLGFGAMRLPGPGVFGPPRDRDEAVRVVRRAVELGVRVIDTAWYYGPDVANEVIAEALRPYPGDLILVTKLGAERGADASWRPARTPEQLRAGCERDLRVLGVDTVGVAHLRWWSGAGEDPDEFALALDTMVTLRREGKIGHIGLSNVTLGQLDAARAVTDVATVSNAYSFGERGDDPVLRRCEEDGIAYLPYFPLAMGAVGADDTVRAVAADLGVSPVRLALAWLLDRSPGLLPIPGTSAVAHLEDNVAAAGLRLSDDIRARLDL
jgi:aryl-alcohol dehydrogenase-like predicted oxidoreductase